MIVLLMSWHLRKGNFGSHFSHTFYQNWHFSICLAFGYVLDAIAYFHVDQAIYEVFYFLAFMLLVVSSCIKEKQNHTLCI